MQTASYQDKQQAVSRLVDSFLQELIALLDTRTPVAEVFVRVVPGEPSTVSMFFTDRVMAVDETGFVERLDSSDWGQVLSVSGLCVSDRKVLEAIKWQQERWKSLLGGCIQTPDPTDPNGSRALEGYSTSADVRETVERINGALGSAGLPYRVLSPDHTKSHRHKMYTVVRVEES